MNFGFDDEQQEIKSTAREFLGSRFKPEKVRELAEEGAYDDDLWRQVCDLGWPGIALDEELGGQGLGIVELAIICEELGYACAPLPFLSNAVAGLILAEAGSDEQLKRWLGGIASGEGRGGVATTQPEPSLVIDADGAAVLLLDDGDGAKLVEPGDATIESLELIDATRRYSHVTASGGDPLPGDVAPAIDRAMIAVAAELVGVAQRAMEMAVDYAKEREQFGRPIGAYQAVSHQCARMLFDTEEARSLTLYAAWTADAEPETLPLAASMAKARASDAAWRVTAASLQVHGGIGFTWEHDLQFWLKRARASGELFGASRIHRERVAGLVGLGEPAAEPAPA